MHPALSASELEALASELGIDARHLEDAVVEAAHEAASSSFNNGTHTELEFWDAHDRVHDDADARARRINGDGVTAQLAFLADGCTSHKALRSLLRDLIP
ncbi:hypothetical protein [Streptomyces sp. NPDC001889]